jgi:hypothetical protein
VKKTNIARAFPHVDWTTRSTHVARDLIFWDTLTLMYGKSEFHVVGTAKVKVFIPLDCEVSPACIILVLH